jgi:serine/threonine-protein kinase RsbW
MEPDFCRTLSDGRAGFPALLDDLESYLGRREAPAAAIAPVIIAADEIVSNILSHGGGAAPWIEVTARVGDGMVVVEVVDDGAAFDPTVAAAPDTSLSLEDRAIGGLGVHLVRRMMDELDYERRDGRNRLRLRKNYRLASQA